MYSLNHFTDHYVSQHGPGSVVKVNGAHVPVVLEKSARGERGYDVFSRMLKERIIFLGDAVTPDLANSVVAQLLFLETENSVKDVDIYINSPGGSIYAGLAIYDTMQFISPNCNTICVGLAASMGAFLLAAGAPGERRSLPHSRIMLHQPSGGTRGTVTDMRIHLEEITRIKTLVHEVLSQHLGKSVTSFFDDLERDHFMTPQEALEYGVIDTIVSKRAR